MTDADVPQGRRPQDAESLRWTSARWQSLVANAPLFMAVVDRTARLLFLNRAQPGHSVADAIGKRVFDFIDPEFHAVARSALQRVFEAGEAVSYETVGAGPNGTKVWYETHLGPIRQGEEVVQASLFALDITARKRAEASVQEINAELELRIEERTAEVVETNQRLRQEVEARGISEARYRRLVESTSDLIWEIDAEGKYSYVSPRVTDMLGYEVEEMLGRSPAEFVTSEDVERVQTQFDETVAHGGEIERLEFTRFHKDGRRLVYEARLAPIVDADGHHVGYRGVSRDITERRRAEAALRQHHEELQAIYDGMRDGLIIANVETKALVKVNHAMCEMLGYTEEELLGLSVPDLHPPEDLPRILETFHAHAEGQRWVAESLPMLRKDGVVFFVDIAPNRLDYRGEFCNIGFFRDVTERRMAADALEREHEVMSQLLKAHDQDRRILAYEIHDGLAQQLAGVIMQLEAVGQRTFETVDAMSRALRPVRQALGDCLKETRRLISGVRPPILDEGGVVEAIQHLICDHKEPTPIDVAFRHDVQFDRLASMQENAIYRIVQESLTNARRHSGSDRVEISLTQNGDVVRIRVQDWGEGFDPEQVDPQSFGLIGIRERVRLLGGTVHIDAAPGQGTRLTAELPIAPDEASE